MATDLVLFPLRMENNLNPAAMFFCANENFFEISCIVQRCIFMNFLYNEVRANPVIIQRFLNLWTVPTKLAETIIV